MYVKFSSENLNPDSYPQHLASIYIYRVTSTSRACSNKEVNMLIPIFWNPLHYGVLQVNWIVNVGHCTFLCLEEVPLRLKNWFEKKAI